MAVDLIADLRSDTVTRPTPAMRRAMADAEVGDDLYGEDPTVRRLEATYAERVGKPAGLFVVSGIMANQLALMVLSRPGTAVVAGAGSHVVAYEDGAAPVNAAIQLIGLDDSDGLLDPVAVAAEVAGVAHHRPEVSAVTVENTHMPSGGRVWPVEQLDAVYALGPPTHLDGARLFNAEVASGVQVDRFAYGATTVMSCLSKGLGAPVGSVLAGPVEAIDEARRWRRRMGGAMRQAGVIAAAGLVAINDMVERLADDHERARRLAEAAEKRWPGSIDPAKVVTNIAVIRLDDPGPVIAHLARRGVLAATIGPQLLRLVTHFDVDDAGIDAACAAIADAP